MTPKRPSTPFKKSESKKPEFKKPAFKKRETKKPESKKPVQQILVFPYDAPTRLQKVLSHFGFGSRRAIERAIVLGEILVDQKRAHLGQLITGREQILWGVHQICLKRGRKTAEYNSSAGRTESYSKADLSEKSILMYHKPVGEICSRVAEHSDQMTVFQHLPPLKPGAGQWIMIGRLDVNTSGLLLFTKDGELANQLMHPKFQHSREYLVRIFGKVTQEQLDQLKTGVQLEDGPANFEEIKPINQHWLSGEVKNYWFKVKITQGRNRIVRRLWESLEDIQVSRLVRIGFAGISLPKFLRPGKYQYVSKVVDPKNKT